MLKLTGINCLPSDSKDHFLLPHYDFLLFNKIMIKIDDFKENKCNDFVIYHKKLKQIKFNLKVGLYKFL